MMPEKVLARARRRGFAAFAFVFAALAGCDRGVVSPNETRGSSDTAACRLEELKTDLKTLRRAEGESARALAEARKRGAPPEEIAALEKKAAKAHDDFKRNIEEQQAVCEERRQLEECQK